MHWLVSFGDVLVSSDGQYLKYCKLVIDVYRAVLERRYMGLYCTSFTGWRITQPTIEPKTSQLNKMFLNKI